MKTLSVGVVLMCAAILFAADVDFSGTWTFDNEKSVVPERGGPGGRGNFAPPDMVITHKKNKVTVTRSTTGRNGEERKMESVYDLSGKVTKEEGRRGGKTEHTAKLQDGVMHVESVRIFERDGQDMEMLTKATWTLVDDGKGLLIESVTDTPMGKREMKSYYTKQ